MGPWVPETEQPAGVLETVRASARLYAPDQYYAALFAPLSVRDDLIALAAFCGEIERVGRQVSEPTLGEIRIAWWRDSLLGEEIGVSGNPVLDAFADVVRRHALPPESIASFLDAHAQALYADAPADDAALDANIAAVDGVPLECAAQILNVVFDARAKEIPSAAARAAGMARIARTLPYALSRGRLPLPEARSPNRYLSAQDWHPQIAWLATEAKDAMVTVRRLLKGEPRPLITALLPLALVEPYFRALQASRHEPTRDLIEIAPLARLWRIARAHWTGRL
jgi:phytoene synthase